VRRYGGGRSPPIDQTWRRIRAYDSATAVAEAQRFAREQPAVLHCTREFLREFDEGTQGAVLGLVYLLFRAMEATREAPPPSLSLEHYILHEYARAGGTGDVADRRRFAHLLVLLKTFLDALEDSAGSAGAS
jgi:hypothetical protein